MNHHHLPQGTADDPFRLDNIPQAVRTAHWFDRKIWCRIIGDDSHLYEVFPGGRNIAYPREMIERRRKLQEPLAEGYRCRHDWATHQDSDPTAAGVIIEEWRQCTKCGQIREPALIH